MPFSIIPYYLFLLYAHSVKGRPLNALAIVYTFRAAFYDGLLSTLVKIRMRREEKIAEALSEKGLIQLLRSYE